MTIKDPTRYLAALVTEADAAWLCDELAYMWRAAQHEAVVAYRAWQESPGPCGYVVYRAAQDRADQAQDVLAHAASVGSYNQRDANVVRTSADPQFHWVQIP